MEKLIKLRNLFCSGGGSKSVLYPVFAMGLEKRGILQEFTHASGTSGGALFASLLGFGCKPKHLLSMYGYSSKNIYNYPDMSLKTVIKQRNEDTFAPESMGSYAINTLLYGKLIGSPFTIQKPVHTEHPLEEALYTVLTNKTFLKEMKPVYGKFNTSKIRKLTFGQWNKFLDELGEDKCKEFGLRHISVAVTMMLENEIVPQIFTSKKDSEFSEISMDVPILKAVSASATFPGVLPAQIINIGGQDIPCIDGGLYLNLPFHSGLVDEGENSMVLSLDNKRVLDAIDYGKYINCGHIDRMLIETLFNTRSYVDKVYWDSVYGFQLLKGDILIGLNVNAAGKSAKAIETLTGEVSIEQLIEAETYIKEYLNRIDECGILAQGGTYAEFAGINYLRYIEQKDESIIE